MLILKLAYRNLFRNTRRTVLTILLISFSLSALIMTDAIIKGTLDLMVDHVTKTLTGEAQIHHPEFRENHNVDLYMDEMDQVMATLSADPEIYAYASRVISGGMISSSYNVSGGLIYGIDADRERDLSKIEAGIIKGKYLSGKNSEILIGKPLAELLEIRLDDRIVLTLSEANSGELAQALFRVSGIFEFGMREIDKNMVFINIHQAREILTLSSNQSHEVVIRFLDPEIAALDTTRLYKTFDPARYETKNWLALNGEIASVIEMSGYSSFILGAVLFLLTSLGVINSMFMSIYERIYEFGVIKAIGTRPLSLAGLIMTEALLIALVSCFFGMLLGYAIGSYTAVHGVPMGEIEFSGIAMSNTILTKFSYTQFVTFPISVTLLTLVAAIYPASFASKIMPSAALQKTL